MIVSQLDRDGCFLSATEADASPLEPGNYLLPAYAISEPPPIIPDGHRALWQDGQWLFISIEPPLPDGPAENVLETAKINKLLQLSTWTKYQTASLEWEGATYQTDDLARDRLMTSLQMHQLGYRPDPAPWRTLDNQMVELSGADLEDLCAAIYKHHQQVTLASFAHKDAIAALTTVEEVDAYEIG